LAAHRRDLMGLTNPTSSAWGPTCASDRHDTRTFVVESLASYHASFASGVQDRGGGPQFWFDIKDAETMPGLLEQVLDTVVAALDSSGVEAGTLTWPEDER
jgi:hypothetical protein